MNLSPISFIKLLLIFILATPAFGFAATSATSRMSATILQGECTTALDTGATYFLGGISDSSINSSSAGNVVLDGPPVEVTAVCTGSANSVPMMRLSPGPGTTAFSDGTYFRDNAASTAGTALGVRFQYMPLRDDVGGPSSSGYLPAGEYALSSVPVDIDGQQITGQFSIWCQPGSGQTWQNCKGESMKISATFLFDIYYP